jgi:hypothetical protein
VERVTEMFPDAPWVFIDRPFGDAWDALCTAAHREDQDLAKHLHSGTAHRLELARDAARVRLDQHPRVLWVDYGKLSDFGTFLELWRHCRGEAAPLWWHRVELLQSLRITVNLANKPKGKLAWHGQQ